MIGKLIRAVSGIRAALQLAEVGYICECGAVLRMAGDFCTEINAIAQALHCGRQPPAAVRAFVDQYFIPRERTPDEHDAAERVRYISREELMKADVRLAEGTQIDGERVRVIHRFLNMTGDAYVHGAYETAMELYNPETGRFEMRGHPNPGKREEFVEAVLLRSHEVVVAIELSALVMGRQKVFEAAREVRRRMDSEQPWKVSPAQVSGVVRS